MTERQDNPRNWCNCIAEIRRIRSSLRSVKESGDEREEARLGDEIAGLDYAHSTGRCRFEYDRGEVPVDDTTYAH